MTTSMALEVAAMLANADMEADANIEFGHLYLYPPDSSRMKSQLREAQRTINEATRLFLALTHLGLRVSTALLVDDVSETHPYSDRDVANLVVDWALQPDYIVRESAMIPLVRRHMQGDPTDCEHMATAWHLARMGWEGFGVQMKTTTDHAAPFCARRLFTVLPARFMSIEAQVQHRLRADFQVPHDRLRWSFV